MDPDHAPSHDDTWTATSPDEFFQDDLATFKWGTAPAAPAGPQTTPPPYIPPLPAASDPSGPPPFAGTIAAGAANAAGGQRPARDPKRLAILVAAAIALMGVLALGASKLFDDDEPAAAVDGISTTKASNRSTTSAATKKPTTTTKRSVTTTTAVKVVPTSAALSTAAATPTSEQRSIYRDGKIYLEGRVKSQALADEYFGKAAAVLGAANVINNYVIDPTAQVGFNGTVEVDIPFVFETGSAQISGRYDKDLSIAVAGMTANPSARMIIVGHTDNVGDPAKNLDLSRRRAEAVRDYMVQIGKIDPSRFDVSGVGDTQPIADNATPEGRTANRRIVVKVTNIIV